MSSLSGHATLSVIVRSGAETLVPALAGRLGCPPVPCHALLLRCGCGCPDAPRHFHQQPRHRNVAGAYSAAQGDDSSAPTGHTYNTPLMLGRE